MVSDEQVAALRAGATGNAETFDLLTGSSRFNDGLEFATLIAAAYVCAARWRFATGWSNSDVIRLVGRLRARDQGEQRDINAGIAERMLISALSGEPMHDRRDSVDHGYAQAAVLTELLSDLDTPQLDALLDKARQIADQ